MLFNNIVFNFPVRTQSVKSILTRWTDPIQDIGFYKRAKYFFSTCIINFKWIAIKSTETLLTSEAFAVRLL